MSKQLPLDFGPHQQALDAIAANDEQAPYRAYARRQEDKFYRSKGWRRARMAVLARDGARCRRCGATRATARIDVDHIVPRNVAPWLALVLTNLQVLCESCHCGKTYRDGLKFWRKMVERIRAPRARA